MNGAILVFNATRRLAMNLSGPRNYATKATSLIYSEYGDPIKVIRPVEEELTTPAPDEVLLKFLAAPVNPADINTIQGNLNQYGK